MLAAEWTEAGRRGDDPVRQTWAAACGTTVPAGVKVMALDPPVPRSAAVAVQHGPAMSSLTLRPRTSIFLPGNFHFFLARVSAARRCRAARIALQDFQSAGAGGLMGLLARPFFRRAAAAVDGFAAMNAGLARQMRRPDAGQAGGDAVRSAVRDGRRGAARRVATDRATSSGSGGWSRRRMSAWRWTPSQALNRTCRRDLTILGDGAERDEVARIAMGLRTR